MGKGLNFQKIMFSFYILWNHVFKLEVMKTNDFCLRISSIVIGVIFVFTPYLLLAQSMDLKDKDQSFTLNQVKSYPFPSNLTSAATGTRIAWAVNKEGLRNIYVAEGPDYKARRLTSYMEDDAQAISSLSLSADGNWCVYIRGGDFGSNWDDALPVNPTFNPDLPKVQIWSIRFEGGDPILLGVGENPVISPRSNEVVFVRGGQIWKVLIDGSDKAKKAFSTRGKNDSPVWSPDGSKLAFRSNRGGHSFIGIFQDMDTPILWADPSFSRDESPRWSGDNNQLVFIRQPGRGGAVDSILAARHNAWKIMSYNISAGEGRLLWEAPKTLKGSVPSTQGRTNLHWANSRIVFLSYHDGWPHLYSIPEDGGKALLLTPGEFMAEYISHNGKWLVFAGNTGEDKFDIDRRHIVRVSVDKPDMEVMTPGEGLEWTPFIIGDSSAMAYISAGAQNPPMVTVMNLKNREKKILAEELIPEDFPIKKMVVPSQVIFEAPDGTPIHATMFQTSGSTKRKPAIIYVHGGPPRQMLLGWHYSSYYSNAYAMNQYLASQGFVVLSVNYRLGIGYGYEFHKPSDGGTRGASEYQDVKAAGEWLANQSFVDPEKIGIYGGSYGGYLTAMALGRDSDLFATGVDIHGVHDRTINRIRGVLLPDQYERAPDAELMAKIAWESSPVSSVPTWISPVLIIHADDDRNVPFSQSTDLVQRLLEKGVDIETLVIVDDTHHFMMFANQMKVNKAAAEYLIRKLMK